jgi:hypothetical protein
VTRHALPIVFAAAFAAVALPASPQSGDAVTVQFSDPSRPGAIRVQMMNGSISVRGEDRRDIVVNSEVGVDDDRERRRGRAAQDAIGLRQLTPGPGLTITEENNRIAITGNSFNARGNVELRVPARTDVTLRGLNGELLAVENVEGEIEVSHQNGRVRLTNVAGSVVAQSQNGDVHVLLTRLAGDKAMSFISFNGNVDVTLPSAARANLKMRSDNGAIFTDFDVEVGQAEQPQPSRQNGRFRIELDRTITGTINGGGPEFELRTFNGNVYLRRGGALK